MLLFSSFCFGSPADRFTAPVIWIRVPETTILRGNFIEGLCENVIPVGRVKVDPAWLFITTNEKSNVQMYLFLCVSRGHSIKVGIAELISTSSIRISALNPKSRHHVTIATPRVVAVWRAKMSIWIYVKKSSVRVQLSRPPRRVRDPNVKVGWILRRNKLKDTSARATWGGGCLGYPTPYKWGLSC